MITSFFWFSLGPKTISKISSQVFGKPDDSIPLQISRNPFFTLGRHSVVPNVFNRNKAVLAAVLIKAFALLEYPTGDIRLAAMILSLYFGFSDKRVNKVDVPCECPT